MATRINNGVDVRPVNTLPASDARESSRRSMTAAVTYLMAARLIAKQDFPNKQVLPKILPRPFSNLGHQLLLDYGLLLVIVWEVIETMKASVERWKKKKRPWMIGCLAAAAASLLLAAKLGNSLPVIPLLFGSLAVYLIVRKNYTAVMKREVGEARADAIKRLAEGEWSPSNPKVSRHVADHLDKVGDGALDGDYAPVITVINNDQPFAGYGRLLLKNLFVCRPKQKEEGPPPPFAEVRSAVAATITEKVSGLGLKEVSFGEVVLLHADSLPAKSVWLDHDHAPRLWIEKERVKEAQSLDPRVSTRTFFAAQVLFPDYMTVATFFVRIFRAGNSAAGTVSVTTLGPPTVSPAYLQNRLLRHKLELEEEKRPGQADKKKPSASVTEEEALNLLRSLGRAGRDNTPFQPNVNTYALSRLRIDEELERRTAEYEKEYGKVVRESALWPGNYYAFTPNWRENNSYDVTPDFFGLPEAVASVQTVYDQISRAVLDTLDGLGFDISDYRDKEGKYSINAEKIGQLVVGEKIHFDKPADAGRADRAVAPAEAKAA